MIRYAVRRVLVAIPTIFIAVTIIFIMMRVIPGDPATAALGNYASESAIQALKERMGLNRPLYLQYLDYLGGLLRGDLGKSFVNGNPVAPLIRKSLPYTVDLALGGILIGVILGIPLGVITAIKRNRMVDYIGRTLSLAGLSFPEFYLGLLLILVFSVYLDLFPSIGGGDLTDIGDRLYHLALPALTLGLIMTAYITRMTRSAMLEVIRQDYVSTARAKGLSEIKVVGKHALKNALISVITVIGLYVGILIAGSVMSEIVFSRPGLGKLLIGAMKNRDYNMMQSILVIITSIIIVVNLLTDIAYSFCDPRIRYD
ncbi:MAG: ABC transporter permease [Nitrospinota bacterium]|nr:MAG: ABC transporter permease [Nitrospinota bacterium]